MYDLTGFYVTIAIIIVLIAYASPEEVLRLCRYVELSIRYQWIMWRFKRIRRKLERDLNIPKRDDW